MIGDQEINRLAWDLLAEVHGQDDYYDSTALIAGKSSLIAEEEDALRIEFNEDVEGRSVLHLQCHLGFDAITFARRGARVVGVDFSKVALAKAASLADRCGVDVEWRCADAAELPGVLDGQFDLVWATIGVLIWISDVRVWMQGVARVLKPGGRLILIDGYPRTAISNESFENGATFRRDIEQGWDYATPLRTGPQVQFIHPIASVIAAAEGAGLKITTSRVHTSVSTDLRLSKQERGTDGRYHWNIDGKPVPLLFELIAVR